MVVVWQLLARPVTEEEFREMAYLKDSFFELGMTTVSHPRCLVESDNNGTIVFEFGLQDTILLIPIGGGGGRSKPNHCSTFCEFR